MGLRTPAGATGQGAWAFCSVEASDTPLPAGLGVSCACRIGNVPRRDTNSATRNSIYVLPGSVHDEFDLCQYIC
jgi:hypothetical protein